MQPHTVRSLRILPVARDIITRLLVLVGSLTWLSIAGCGSLLGPSSPLAGAWRTVAIPSGSGVDLSLATAGAIVTGVGHEYRLQYLADSLTVTGRRQADGAFRLTLTFGSGAVATYAGRMVGSDQLDGTWAAGDQSPYRLAFYRQ